MSLNLYSCTIERLDEVRKAAEKEKFDPAEYAQTYWTDKLIKNLDEAVDASVLFQEIKKDPEEARNKYALSLGMSRIKIFHKFFSPEILCIFFRIKLLFFCCFFNFV